MREEAFLLKLIKNPGIFGVGLIILILIGFAFVNNFSKSYQVKKEVKELEEQVDSLENQNFQLVGLIKYSDSKDFIEKKARTELGLKKPGEDMVIIQLSKEKDGAIKNSDSQSQTFSNLRKWWNYLFSKK